MSHMVTHVFASYRFDIFYYVVTICDMALESVIMSCFHSFGLIIFWLKVCYKLCLLWCCLQIISWNFSSCRNILLCGCSFCNHFIYFYLFRFCCALIFLTSFSCNSLSWHVEFCCSNDILVYFNTLSVQKILFLCACIPRKSCMYPCIAILRKGVFMFSWFFLPVVHLFGHISLRACRGSSW